MNFDFHLSTQVLTISENNLVIIFSRVRREDTISMSFLEFKENSGFKVVSSFEMDQKLIKNFLSKHMDDKHHLLESSMIEKTKEADEFEINSTYNSFVEKMLGSENKILKAIVLSAKIDDVIFSTEEKKGNIKKI